MLKFSDKFLFGLKTLIIIIIIIIIDLFILRRIKNKFSTSQG